MRNLSLIIFLCGLMPISLFAQTAFQSGNVAYEAKEFQSAVGFYEKAIMDNPGNPQLLEKLANCYRFLNKMKKAELYYSRVVQNPNTKNLNHYWYAMVLKSNKKYDEALKALEKFQTSNVGLVQRTKASCAFAKKNIAVKSAFAVSKESGISSPKYDDYAPVLHRNHVLITSSRKIVHDKLPGGYSDPSKQNFIYSVNRGSDGQLSGAKLIKGNTMFMPQNNLSPFDVTVDQKRVVSTFNQFTDGQRHMRGAKFAKLGMEYNYNNNSINDFGVGEVFPFEKDGVSASFPSLTDNGNTMYFAADGLPGSYGGYDIYITRYVNGSWTTPINLGPNVNTAGDEVCPHIANNGHLYFASDFHKGYGGYDVFRSRKMSNVWKDVRNLGPQVNSSFDDMYFVFDASKRIGYFSSNRNGKYDIYSAILKGDEELLLRVNDTETNVAVSNGRTTSTTTTGRTTTTAGTTTTGVTGTNTTTTGGTTTVGTTTIGTTTYSGGTTTTAGTTTTTTGTTSVGSNPTAGHNPPGTVPCAMNFYIGGVIDGTTKRPLEGATVYIKNQRTGEERKVKDPTNLYGEYSVILDPLTDYTIAISKAGFKNLLFDVNTGTGGKKTLLSTRPMYGAGTVDRDKWGNVVDNNKSTKVDDTPSTEELIAPPSSSKYYSYESDRRTLPNYGYVIQAIVTKQLNQAQRFELSKFGNIITEQKGTEMAYRVGIFVDQNHLESTLAEVRKTYKDAFKIPVTLNTTQVGGKIATSSQVIYPPVASTTAVEEVVYAPNQPAPIPSVKEEPPIVRENDRNNWTTTPTYAPPTNTVSTPTVEPAIVRLGVEFKVQLGAFKEAEKISFSNVSHLGMIEKQKRSNGLTYFYLASYKTLDAARVARTKAKEGGVASPFIVAFKDGKKVKISDVVPN